ncbi:MAG: type IX secretion system membrane protein PorP/SprF [Chitinophagaceae bacterium]|nr:type IX secretion system membrane protein PorP/SprF [Chitinophagaceae bacterium]
MFRDSNSWLLHYMTSMATCTTPLTAGASKHGSIGASYRKMWDGIAGGPQTTILFGSGYLPNAKIGIGGYVYNDVTGPTKRTGAQVALSYHIPLANDATFSLGLEGRFQQFAIDKVKLQESLGNDPVLGTQDSRFKGDAGFGVAYTGKKLKAGISVSQLIQSKLDFYTGNLTRTEEGRLYRHYYLHGSYTIDADGSTKLIPNILFIYLPNAPTEFQGGIRVEHKDIFLVGSGIEGKTKLDAFCRCESAKEIYYWLLFRYFQYTVECI